MADTLPETTPPRARILLADDSKIVRVTASRILAPHFDVVLAEDGEEAWGKICADNSIQVVFTDLGMPRLDGYGLIERIRQSQDEGIRNQPVIVITGAAEEEGVRRRVFELGATDFITKPFKSTEILARAEAHASYKRDKQHLQQNVDLDLLTGTLNRQGIARQLDKDVAFVNRHAENIALILFELDDFKTLFARVGKEAADKILKQIGNLLVSAVRKEDSVGRYGLEKFVLILPMAKTEGVVILAKRICEKLQSQKVTVNGTPLSLSLSAGISTARKGQPIGAQSLMDLAEKALANARKVGPGEVQLLKLEPHQKAPSLQPISIDACLSAIAEGQANIDEGQQDLLVSRLQPLIALLSERHRQTLFEK